MSTYSYNAQAFEDDLCELMKNVQISGVDVVDIMLNQAAKYVDAWPTSDEPDDSASVRRMASIIREAQQKFVREHQRVSYRLETQDPSACSRYSKEQIRTAKKTRYSKLRDGRSDSSRGETVKTKTRHVQDPDTGRILEEYPFDDPLAVVIQEALDRRILEYTGTDDPNGRPIYQRTTLGEHGLN
jgi:hypothetical protein